MSLLYGVVPILESNPPGHRSEFAILIEQMLLQRGWASRGDRYIALAGKPLGQPGVVNTVAVRRVGELDTPQEIASVERD